MKEKLGRQDEEKARQVIECQLWRWITAVHQLFPSFLLTDPKFCRSEVLQEPFMQGTAKCSAFWKMRRVLISLIDLFWIRALCESAVHLLFSSLSQQGVASQRRITELSFAHVFLCLGLQCEGWDVVQRVQNNSDWKKIIWHAFSCLM